MKFSKLIYRNIFRNRLRAILTVLLMAAIFFFIATLLSILENFTLFSEAGKGQNRLATQSAFSLGNVLPVAHEQKIRQIPGIADVCQMQWFGAYYKEPKNFFANFAIDHHHMRTVFDDYAVPDKEFEAYANDRQGAIVGPELMKRFGWKVGDHITLKSTIFPFNPELNIRGVYQHPIDSSSLFFRMDYFQQAMGDNGLVGMFWIKVKDAKNMTAVSKQIDDMFRNSTDPTETFTEKEFQLNFLSMMGDIKLLFHSISLCSIFMVILLAAITMSMSARDRDRRAQGHRLSSRIGIVADADRIRALDAHRRGGRSHRRHVRLSLCEHDAGDAGVSGELRSVSQSHHRVPDLVARCRSAGRRVAGHAVCEHERRRWTAEGGVIPLKYNIHNLKARSASTL